MVSASKKIQTFSQGYEGRVRAKEVDVRIDDSLKIVFVVFLILKTIETGLRPYSSFALRQYSLSLNTKESLTTFCISTIIGGRDCCFAVNTMSDLFPDFHSDLAEKYLSIALSPGRLH